LLNKGSAVLLGRVKTSLLFDLWSLEPLFRMAAYG